MMFNIKEVIQATRAEKLKGNVREAEEFNISTDTRTIKSGDIYLPLKGASFDGENFIDNAIDSGAVGYFTTKEINNEKAKVILQVKDTLKAYLKLAQYRRKKINPITIAITGSSGKTSTKEIVYSVLSKKFKTHKTFSNHNNEIGFCQTVLQMPDDTEILIVEMGMRGLGEIELITTHLNPDIAIITNAGTAHIGRLGSLDNIAKAKCEIAKGLHQEGVFIAKNQEIIKKHLKYNGKKIYYSIDDVKILEKAPSYSKFEYNGNEYELNVEGDYNIENSLSAIEIGKKLGMTYEEIKDGLASYKPIEKRWEEQEVNGLKFIDDSYNANPDSMKASVKAFVELYNNPVVVLGNMLELGEEEVKYHQQVGEYLSTLNKNVKYLTVGKLAKEIGTELVKHGFEVKSFDTNKEVSCYIVENLNKSNTIFLKASNSMKLSEIIENVKRDR